MRGAARTLTDVAVVRARLCWSACVLAAAVLALAGCGSTKKPLAAKPRQFPTAATTSASLVSQGAAGRRLAVEANDICRAVRQGAPPSIQPPYKRAALLTYTQAARAAAQRTVLSLQRLGAQQGATRSLGPIAGGYAELEAAYVSAATVVRDDRSAARLGQVIRLRELAVSSASRAAGVPACGVAGL